MKKIYNAPEAIEVVLNTQDIVTISTADTGDGICDDWNNGKTA